MEKGVFEKAGPALVIGTVFVLCAAAVWMFLSRGDNRMVRGGDDKQIVQTPGNGKGTMGLPVPGEVPDPSKAVPGPAHVTKSPIASGDLHANPDTAPEAGPPVFNQPNMDGPPPDTTYYPGPGPQDVDPNVPDGPPADTTYHPGPPPLEPQPGQPDGPPMDPNTNPNQGPPQTDPAQPPPK